MVAGAHVDDSLLVGFYVSTVDLRDGGDLGVIFREPVTEAALLLASDCSDTPTGNIINVDGASRRPTVAARLSGV